jgi:choline kinase
MYADSNSIQSLLCGLGQVCEGRDTLVVDSDVILDEGVLQKFLSNVNGSALLIDTLKMHSEIDMKAQVLRGCIVDLSKTLPLEATTGEFFGVSFFPDSEAKKLSRCCDELISSGGSQLWYEDQGNRTLDAGKMFDKSFDHRVIP